MKRFLNPRPASFKLDSELTMANKSTTTSEPTKTVKRSSAQISSH